MRTRPEWKPCDKLKAADFASFPIWGFDLSREDDDSDETWVRPYAFAKTPRTTDLLFVAARLLPRERRARTGALMVRFSGGRPVIEGLALLRPRYCALALRGPKIPASERSMVESFIPDAKELFPLTYEAELSLGRQQLPLRGVVRLGW